MTERVAGSKRIRRLLMKRIVATGVKLRNALGKSWAKSRAKDLLLALTGMLLLGLVGLSDYLTGPEISFGVFYFLPIWLMTWNFDRGVAVIFSVLCALVWFVVDDVTGVEYSAVIIPFWNASARLAYFLSFALLVSHMREQLRRSKEEVKQLSGLLPICASCKKIRDDEGYWREIESSIRRHSDTVFSH